VGVDAQVVSQLITLGADAKRMEAAAKLLYAGLPAPRSPGTPFLSVGS